MESKQSIDLITAVYSLTDQLVAMNGTLGLIESRLMEIANSVDVLSDELTNDD